MDNIVIMGAAGHAKVIIDIVEREGKFSIAGLVDKSLQPGQKILGYPIIGKDEDLPQLLSRHSIVGGVVAIGDNFIRGRVVRKIKEICPNFKFVNAFHPNACIAKEVSVGEGTVVMAGVTINASCSIGNFCILNTNCSLDHDSCMADFSSLAPNSVTGGNSHIGRFSSLSMVPP